jgi:hypothetical protein
MVCELICTCSVSDLTDQLVGISMWFNMSVSISVCSLGILDVSQVQIKTGCTEGPDGP